MQTTIEHKVNDEVVPGRSAANQDAVNVKENVISEHGTESNRSVKKRWENEARKQADDNPDSWSVCVFRRIWALVPA
jgi:hypothetical protein